MPYKDKKEQAEYLRRYGTPYKRQYRQFQRQKLDSLGDALKKDDINLAREIWSKKPNIHLFRNTWQDLSGQKRRKR
jgi:hypothetical protein